MFMKSSSAVYSFTLTKLHDLLLMRQFSLEIKALKRKYKWPNFEKAAYLRP